MSQTKLIFNCIKPTIADINAYLFELLLFPVYFLMTNHMTNHVTPLRGALDYVHVTHRMTDRSVVCFLVVRIYSAELKSAFLFINSVHVN